MNIHRTFRSGFTALLFASALATVPALRASVVAAWDFENASLGQVSAIAASTTSASVTSAAFDTGNNGVENFGGTIGNLSMTRFFSDFGNRFPFLNFTLSSATEIDTISFAHYHNHNPGFPTSPDYNFDVQIDLGSGWVNLATGLVASSGTSGATAAIAGPGLLGPGTYSIRWIGNNFQFGVDSNTEFFGPNDVTLSVPENSTSLALFALGMGAVLAARRRVARL